MAMTFDDDAALARESDDGIRAFVAVGPDEDVARRGTRGLGTMRDADEDASTTFTFRGAVGPRIVASSSTSSVLSLVPFSMVCPFANVATNARDVPLVVVMHPSYSSAVSMERTLARYAARLRCIVVSFDAPHHGARGVGNEDVLGDIARGGAMACDVGELERRATAGYAAALVDCYARNDANAYGRRPYIVDGAVDCLRVCRALCEKFGVRRVGLTGVSLGGMMATTAAARWSAAWASSGALDWTVVACAPMIGFSDFRWALLHDSWRARIMSLPSEMRDVVFEDGERPTVEETFEFWTRALSGIVTRSTDDFDDAGDGGDNLLRILHNGVDFLAVQGDEDERNPMRGVEAALARCARLSETRGPHASTISVVAQRNIGHDATDAMHDVVHAFLAERIWHRDVAPKMSSLEAAFEPSELNLDGWRVLTFDTHPKLA